MISQHLDTLYKTHKCPDLGRGEWFLDSPFPLGHHSPVGAKNGERNKAFAVSWAWIQMLLCSWLCGPELGTSCFLTQYSRMLIANACHVPGTCAQASLV